MSRIPFELLKPKNNVFDDIEYNGIIYRDDVWDLSAFLNKDGTRQSLRIYFDKFQTPYIRESVKRHAWSLIGGDICIVTISKTISTIDRYLQAFMKAYDFTTLYAITNDLFGHFLAWMIETYQINQAEPISSHTLQRGAKYMLDFLNNAKKLDFPEQPFEYIVPVVSLYKYFGLVRRKDKPKNEKHIPDDIFEKVVMCAKSEEDYLYTEAGEVRNLDDKLDLPMINFAKFSILIQANTGLRIEEVLTLKAQCHYIKTIRGKQTYWLRRRSSKTEVEVRLRDIIISKEIYELIEHLHRLTKEHRIKGSFKWLMFNYYNKCFIPIRANNYNYIVLHPFKARHGIDHPFTSHAFRHTFAYRLINYQNVPVRVLQAHYAHVSISMTLEYIKVKRDRLKNEVLKSFIRHADTMIVNGEAGKEFQEGIKEAVNNPSLYKDEEEMLENISKRYVLTPLGTGACRYNIKVQQCPNLGVESCYSKKCSYFVTNPEFLPTYRWDLEMSNKELDKIQLSGAAWERVNFIKDKINIIKMMISDLESKGSYKAADYYGEKS